MAELELRRSGREGGRWINKRPSGEEVADWFTGEVFIHEGLDASNYVSGVTLIQAIEKSKDVGGVGPDGDPVLVDVSNIAHVPYMRVDTRIRYWHDLMALHAEEWVGVIEATPAAQLTEAGYFNAHLPPGFFRLPVPLADGKVANFVACSMRCRIFKRDGFEVRRHHEPGGKVENVYHGEIVLDAPAGTKAVNLLGKWGEDENALMKAETGAIGRALGMAGMLVLGGGIATAEDVQEARESEHITGAAAGAEAAMPPAVEAPPDEAAMRQRVTELVDTLKEADPTKLEEFRSWAKERKFPAFTDCNATQLKGCITKLERHLGVGGGAA